MKLSDLKNVLPGIDHIQFILPDGTTVPPHFHVTEIGTVIKHFIDCGGAVRTEEKINFQLYTAADFDHRLGAQKLHSIIELSENQLHLKDLEIEVEYQSETIGKYGLDFIDGTFLLTPTHTDCLAKDNCGIPAVKPKLNLSALQSKSACCTPDSGCC